MEELTDLRTDFYKFLDTIKHELTQQEYMDIVRQENKKELIELLKEIIRGG